VISLDENTTCFSVFSASYSADFVFPSQKKRQKIPTKSEQLFFLKKVNMGIEKYRILCGLQILRNISERPTRKKLDPNNSLSWGLGFLNSFS
jgi:hypothetical protein